MTIEDLKVILNQSFICSEGCLQEFVDPTKGNQKTPYKSINLKTKRIEKYLLFRIQPEHLSIFCEEKAGVKPPKGLRIMCDFFLCFDFENKLYVLLIELKGENTKHAKEQIESAECLFNFFIATAKRINIDVEKEILYRRIIIKDGVAYRPQTSFKGYQQEGKYYIAPRKNSGDSLLIDDFINPN